MRLSFREKSLWATLVIMVFIWAYYFDRLRDSMPGGAADRAETLWLFVSMTVIVVVFEIASHIVLAVLSPREADQPSDERDRQISRKANSHANWILGAGVLTIAFFAMFNDVPSVVIAHALVLLLIFVEAVTSGLSLLYYRRGV